MGGKQPPESSFTRGTLKATACPWCRKPNDFSDMRDFQLDVGEVCSCDHCGRRMKIHKMQPVTVIVLRRA